MQWNWQRSGLVAFLLVGTVGLARYDLVVEVSYRVVTVEKVQIVDSRGLFTRFVTVMDQDRRRGVWAKDPYVVTQVGGRVCLEERQFVLRRWRRYALAVPFYCPGLKEAPVAAAPGLSAG